jgi:hypothetical protein
MSEPRVESSSHSDRADAHEKSRRYLRGLRSRTYTSSTEFTTTLTRVASFKFIAGVPVFVFMASLEMTSQSKFLFIGSTNV